MYSQIIIDKMEMILKFRLFLGFFIGLYELGLGEATATIIIQNIAMV
nr:hypothetical protein [Clostridium sp. DJ247]